MGRGRGKRESRARPRECRDACCVLVHLLLPGSFVRTDLRDTFRKGMRMLPGTAIQADNLIKLYLDESLACKT